MNCCTYFDYKFLVQGLTCIYTYKKYHKEAFFYVLALDKKTIFKLKNLKLDYIFVIDLNLILKKYPYLKKQKKMRNLSEFYFMLTPYLIHYIFNNFKKKNLIYLDADLIFFSNLNRLKKKFQYYDILASYHDHIDNKYNSVGKYNVGFLFFKRNSRVLNQIKIWMKQCLISTTIDDNYAEIICGDQKYIESWANNKKTNFSGIKIKNFNIGGWNINSKKFTLKNNKMLCDNSKLYSIHANFVELDLDKSFFVSSSSRNFNKYCYNMMLKHIYENTCKLYDIKIMRNKINFLNIKYLVLKYIMKNLYDLRNNIK
jgi:hypothetical protein